MYDYRNEWKYILSEEKMTLLEHKVRSLLGRDIHQNGSSYRIASLYFDNIYRKCCEENFAGIDMRNKYRIRRYNDDVEHFKFECKSKVCGMTSKQMIEMSRGDFLTVMDGNYMRWLYDDNNIAAKNIFASIQINLLRPACIVVYDRSAYAASTGNVRITFDRNIRSTRKISDFLKDGIATVATLPQGYHILEVKFDDILPGYLSKLFELADLQQTSFSKYGLSVRRLSF